MARIGIVDLTPSDHHDIMIAPYLNALILLSMEKNGSRNAAIQGKTATALR